ncbi:hypothetical protein ACQEVB_31465 [Pseudonocardia sp. CA-107938]|uniref:hypothetical protein n=1 Tax=Pseudonocardia sp. CA-107938 TaxID=3240021 RepID=UPI003D8E501F
MLEPTGGDEWFGMPGVRPLSGVDELLHVGDAVFHRGRFAPEHGSCPPLLEQMEWAGAADVARDEATVERLVALHRDHADRVEIVAAAAR